MKRKLHTKTVNDMTIRELIEWCERRIDRLDLDACKDCPFKVGKEDCLIRTWCLIKDITLLVEPTFEFEIDSE